MIGPDRKTYLYPLAEGEPTAVPGVDVNEAVADFASDSRSVYVYRRGEGPPTNVSRLDVATGRREPWRSLTPADAGGVSDLNPLPGAEWRVRIYNYNRTLSDLYVVEGVK